MTKAEQIFLNRMIPHIINGMSFEEAGKAVLADDERLWLVSMDQNKVGETIRIELAKEVYNKIKNSACI